MEIVHIQRKPTASQFSVEVYFALVRNALRRVGPVRLYRVPFWSKGFWGRVGNCVAAWWNQGHINHITGDIHYVALLLPRRRTMVTVLDCQILERLRGWRRAIVKLLWYTWPLRHAYIITTISEETRRRLLEIVSLPLDRVAVVPVAISSRFQPCPRVFQAAFPTILQVGTKANKNVYRLIRALEGIPCRLDLVGPLNGELQVALQRSRIVYRHFEGLGESQLVELYQGCDIVAFVSTSEGFGMPIVEAQAVERVCVTSNCSSMPEVAGAGACLVDPWDIESIRAGFLRVIHDKEYRENLIVAGRENRNRFRIEVIAEQYQHLYQRMLDANDRRS